MIKEKYNQWRLSYQIGRIRTIGYIHKLQASEKKYLPENKFYCEIFNDYLCIYLKDIK